MFLKSHVCVFKGQFKVRCVLSWYLVHLFPLVMFCVIAFAVVSTVICIMQLAWTQERDPQSHCLVCSELDCWVESLDLALTQQLGSSVASSAQWVMRMGIVRIQWDDPHKAIRTESCWRLALDVGQLNSSQQVSEGEEQCKGNFLFFCCNFSLDLSNSKHIHDKLWRDY